MHLRQLRRATSHTGGVWQARLTRQPDSTRPHRAEPQLCIQAHVPGAARPQSLKALSFVHCPCFQRSSVSPHRPPHNNDRPQPSPKERNPFMIGCSAVVRSARVTITELITAHQLPLYPSSAAYCSPTIQRPCKAMDISPRREIFPKCLVPPAH